MVNVAVVVMGDFGRSPRMQYHALSLAKHGIKVSVVASQGSPPIRELQNHPCVDLHLIKDLKFEAWPRLLRYGLKAIYQTLMLLWHLFLTIPSPSAVLVQNPPSVPTLPCVWFACKVRRSKFVLDWHNYGYSILAMNVRRENSLVKIYHWIEFFFGRRADCGFCVSEGMRKDLLEKGINNIVVLHDKPPLRFQPRDWNEPDQLQEVHDLLVRLSESDRDLQRLATSPHETVLTRMNEDKLELKSRRERPFLLLSSTSWTEDEDFGLLLAALSKYDKAASEDAPDILCVVTGKGPQKEFYLEKISGMKLKKVHILTPWLEIQDYPMLVSICDLGVCLHKSSSSLDLPMKIVDMFGCCVPVLAWNYKCISELVKVDQTGLLFESSDQLCKHLIKMCDNRNIEILNLWRRNIMAWQETRWERNWDSVARGIFL
ncbi:chitobiosyldiphosphodolichol beta-mannosyltransferase [Galendromus occidentalis]|uniref:Beta-1,4-mannosyltransferase n=1 Tax=Galendromus occidentalis TaxID=34638 RepID=A0AAJ7SCP9_9ACAR|nr:chitobiosyldiphosphodolichol beta-mannosyltransferase [Galendromus occidentalis]XP_028966323.1 chitobiosyldiphosphodolichol beta-mannosyltransferase [Galendromus occidentalis]